MTKRQRTTAEFYATLASMRLDGGQGAPLAALLPRFERILALSAPTAGISGPKPSKTALLAALGGVQRETATVLRALLGDGTAAVPAPLWAASPRWRLTDGQVTEVWEPSGSVSTAKQLVLWGLAPLVELIRLPRFPFGLCPVCDTVFVRVLGQKFCSRLCTYRGTEGARRDERRGYMKIYMREYRAAERARRQKEK